MVRSFGDPPPAPPAPSVANLQVSVVPVLDAVEMKRIADQIQRAVYEAVRAGFRQATEELASEDDDDSTL